jgi:hypothetical protein
MAMETVAATVMATVAVTAMVTWRKEAAKAR